MIREESAWVKLYRGETGRFSIEKVEDLGEGGLGFMGRKREEGEEERDGIGGSCR